jgi:DNA-binding CsgD family transcriptional regulator
MLAPGDFTVGRGLDCGLPLDDEKVSRLHAVIHVGANELHVEDRQSRNGVRVNGQRIETKQRVGHGDVIEIGRQQIHVVEEEERLRRAAVQTVGTAEDSSLVRKELGLPPVSKLSRREQEVLRLIALGHTHKDIATQLGVSVKTVETYRARVAEKLELKSRAELVRYALEAGLVE